MPVTAKDLEAAGAAVKAAKESHEAARLERNELVLRALDEKKLRLREIARLAGLSAGAPDHLLRQREAGR